MKHSISELKKSIPQSAFVPSLPRSLFYFFWDVSLLALLYYAMLNYGSVWMFPIFWFAAGTIMWALFVVGHDCGHGSFSHVTWINFLFGHLAHTPLLVPFHGWKVSHRTHHNHTGDIDKDESWHPLTETQYKSLSPLAKIARYKFFLIVFPLYLFVRSSGRDGSHFLPSSPLFPRGERKHAVTSLLWMIGMVCFLVWVTWQYGFLFFISYYFLPYTVFVVWLSLVTFLHHTDVNIPWYRGKDWNYAKGALSTVDRSYGIFEPIHHNIGTHVVHHLFPTIPHYQLKFAKSHLKKLLGPEYRESNESIRKVFFRSASECIIVPDSGGKVFFRKP
ncbi:fatty acid desaturase [Leptospira ognonensis]|uniref:Fatty acid desaturase n=1 Tax=Leptospira ognonensis TaxID=2484945 RepID=A0A4R9K0A0_9LEPT|nr:fatty acid desaturase [Leptospira ognonensis]TGL58112.1 fatty acid desaturase [Leptospira ognonensis]